ncbi:MAG: hypothetical protein HYV45_02850 [Candidatus Moranbacteria bacterium]|nr:hypothetical protein [Candidatus Moranbacteria bacterium]
MQPKYCRVKTWSAATEQKFDREKKQSRLAGSVDVLALGVLLMLFVMGGGYLYSVNQTAVHGYQVRSLEKELHALQQENTELAIREADLRSLHRIEASTSELRMQKAEATIYLEARREQDPLVLRDISSRFSVR